MPARTGALVRIQRRVGSHWRTVKSAVLVAGQAPSSSAFSVKLRIRRNGRFRALMPGDATNAANGSRTRTIRVH